MRRKIRRGRGGERKGMKNMGIKGRKKGGGERGRE